MNNFSPMIQKSSKNTYNYNTVVLTSLSGEIYQHSLFWQKIFIYIKEFEYLRMRGNSAKDSIAGGVGGGGFTCQFPFPTFPLAEFAPQHLLYRELVQEVFSRVCSLRACAS